MFVAMGCTLSEQVEQHIRKRAKINIQWDLGLEPESQVRLFLFDNAGLLYLDTLIGNSALQSPEGTVVTYLYDGHYKAVAWSNTGNCSLQTTPTGRQEYSSMYLATEPSGDDYRSFDNIGYGSFEFDIAKGDSIVLRQALHYDMVEIGVEITGLQSVEQYEKAIFKCRYRNELAFDNTLHINDLRTIIPPLQLDSDYALRGTFYTPYDSSSFDFEIELSYPSGERLYAANIGPILSEISARTDSGKQKHIDISVNFTRASITCTVEDWSETVDRLIIVPE